MFLPVFGSLLNLATTAVSTIWRPLAYQVARTVLDRLKRYLMSGDDDDTTSPGTIAIDVSPGTGVTGDQVLPIVTANYIIEFFDFQPQAPPFVNNWLGVGGSGIVAGNYNTFGTFTRTTYVPSLVVTFNFSTPASITPFPLMTITGATGVLLLAISTTPYLGQPVGSNFHSYVSLVVNGVSFRPV